MIAARAEVLHLKRESEYGWYGMYSDVQRMALVIEPGGHALIKVKRIHKTKVGFWAGLFGAKSTAEEVLRHIEVGYDGNEITVQTVLEERRDVTRALPTEVAPRLITA